MLYDSRVRSRLNSAPKSNATPRSTQDLIYPKAEDKKKLQPVWQKDTYLRFLTVFFLGCLFGWKVLGSPTESPATESTAAGKSPASGRSSAVEITPIAEVSLADDIMKPGIGKSRSLDKKVIALRANGNENPGKLQVPEGRFHCVVISPRWGRPWVEPGGYCFAEEPYVYDPDTKDIWAGFIGIGPARTGTTVLFNALGSHPEIQLGDPALNEQTCCEGSELYFFERDDMLLNGMEYYKRFFGPRQSGVRIAGEKTPRYSDNPLVPYRVRAALGPKVKLIFTIRNPMEAVISLWRMRMSNRGNDSQVGFETYIAQLLSQQTAYDHCTNDKVKRALHKHGALAPGYSMGLFEAFRFLGLTWKQAQRLDELAYPCWAQLDKIRLEEMQEQDVLMDTGGIAGIMDERLQHYFMRDNLQRWTNIFGKDQILCVWNDELKNNGKEVLNKVAEFLGVANFPAEFNLKPINSSTPATIEKLKVEIGKQYRYYCNVLRTRNKRINQLCPRMFDDSFKWC